MFVEERNASWSTPYKFNGKEQDEETGLAYYGARYYDPRTSVWLSVDPLAEEYPNMSSYVYCANNPVRYIDPDGRDWVEGANKEITWRKDVNSKNHADKGVLKKGERYLGEAVVVFNGSRSEKLGTDDTIEGKGSKNAKVTLYAPDATKTELTGFTMTSNADNFTPIDDGEYSASRREYGGKNPKIPKYYQLKENGKDNIRTLDGAKNKNAPNQKRDNGEGYKTEIFIHRTNPSGTAGGRGGKVSTGCLLLTNSSFEKFHQKMGNYPVGKNFKVILNRTK